MLMKRIVTFLIVFTLLCEARQVWGETTAVTMPYGETKTVTVTDPITFYDSGGSSYPVSE